MSSNGPKIWEIFLKLLPQNLLELLLAVVALVLLLAIYYLLPVYSRLDRTIENAKWWSCAPEDQICGEKTEYEDLEITLRVPKSVSDFLASEIEVTVKNTGDALSGTLNIAIEVTSAGTLTPTIYLYAEEGKDSERRNTLIFPSLPPYSEVTGIYRIRVAKGQDGEQLKSRVYVNGTEVQPEFNVRMTFNRWGALGVWAAQIFLLPPGSNWIVALLALILSRSCSKMVSKVDWKKGFRRIRSKLQPHIERLLGQQKASKGVERVERNDAQP